MWSNPRARAAVDCGEMDRRDAKEELVVGNASGGMPGGHGIKAILLSHTYRVEPHHHGISLPKHQHLPLNNRETGPSNTWHIELPSRTLIRGPL